MCVGDFGKIEDDDTEVKPVFKELFTQGQLKFDFLTVRYLLHEGKGLGDIWEEDDNKFGLHKLVRQVGPY